MSRFPSLLLCLTAFLSFLAGSAAHPKSADDKPAIILIPAAFSKAAVYDDVKGCLSGLGYEVEAIELPSVGKRAANVDRDPDIKESQKSIDKFLKKGKNVSHAIACHRLGTSSNQKLRVRSSWLATATEARSFATQSRTSRTPRKARSWA